MLCVETAPRLPRAFPNLRQLTIVEVHRHVAPNVSYGEGGYGMEEDAASSWETDSEEFKDFWSWIDQVAAIACDPSWQAAAATPEKRGEAADDQENPAADAPADAAADLDVWDNLVLAVQILFNSRGRAIVGENNITVLKLCGDCGRELSPHLPRLFGALHGCDELQELHLHDCIDASSYTQLTALTQLTSLHILHSRGRRTECFESVSLFTSLTSLRELGFAGIVSSNGLDRSSSALTVLKVDELFSIRLPQHGIHAEEAQHEGEQQGREQQGPGQGPGHQQQQQLLQEQLQQQRRVLLPLPPGLHKLCAERITVRFTSEQLRAMEGAGGGGAGPFGPSCQYLFSPVIQQRLANGLLPRNTSPELTLVHDQPVRHAAAVVALEAGGDGNNGGGGDGNNGGGGGIPGAQLIRRLLRDVAMVDLGNALTLRGVTMSRILYPDLLECKPEKLVLEPPYGDRPLEGVEVLAGCRTLQKVTLDATPVFSKDVFDEDDPWVESLASSLHQLFVDGYRGHVTISYKLEEEHGNLLKNGMKSLKDMLQERFRSPVVFVADSLPKPDVVRMRLVPV
ncbi:hypothetical protein Vretifemale_17448 [Volvox reticuliferus]|uniref:Uncharacterized protein n=1 Tax=Volvox reticuliferus TaxID=1737510 RepID=A0A8J4CVS3_9CHLO|nr:hypothetical protein Vretifemale_17448 [Volvox reticuliferus]